MQIDEIGKLALCAGMRYNNRKDKGVVPVPTLAISMSLNTFFNLWSDIFYIPGIILVLVVNRIFAYKYRITKLHTFLYTVVMIVFGFIGSYIGADLYNFFRHLKGQESAAVRTVFGTILVDIILITVLLLLEKAVRALIAKKTGKPVKQVSMRDVYDALQPGAMLLIIFTKFRCLLVGCCMGIPVSWGLYFKRYNATFFPVQIVEATMSFLILVACYFITQTKFFRRGMALFLGVGAFSFGRFFLEFLMYYAPENRTYLGHLTFYQCLSILIFAVCAGVVIYLYKTQPSDPLPGKMRPYFEKREQERALHPKQSVTQQKYNKGWQSTKKKYKKKKK